jgi:GT2 family glycosyltransferase
MTADLAVIVVHHRGREHLLAALAALARQEVPGRRFEIVLVDNASSGGAIEEVRRRHPAVRVVAAGTNRGFAGGCRLGVDAAEAPLLAFINDDAVAEAGWLAALAGALEGAPADVAAVGGRLTDSTGERNDFSDGFLTFDGHAFQSDFGKPLSEIAIGPPGGERLFACGGNMIVRREAWKASEGFDEDYFAYLEDVDFGWRQWIAGRRVLFEPRAVARHRGGATGEALGVFRRGYLFEKNAFMTAYKNLDAESWPALAPAILAAFSNRVARMLAERNPAAGLLSRDPYAAAPDSGRWRWMNLARRLSGIAPPLERAVIDDPLTIAHLRAMLWIFGNADRLAAKRAAVQAERRVSDREIFARFPLRRVPTYPGDDAFGGAFFSSLWPERPELLATTLEAIFGGAA